jgi:putative heme iron utilization protein
MPSPERRPTAFSPTTAAKRVLRSASTASLATLSPEGSPFASLVTVATDHAGAPILLISRLAVHTQNLARDDRASLLLVEPGGEAGDPLAGARLSLTGRVSPPDDDPVIRERFLAFHPEAGGYAGFPDFSFRRFTIGGGHLVAGFGRIIDLRPADILTDCAGAEDLLAAEPSAIEHMNADHAEALELCATHLLHLPAGAWRMTGADPEGIDVTNGDRHARLPFPTRVTTANGLRAVLTDLTRAARATP